MDCSGVVTNIRFQSPTGFVVIELDRKHVVSGVLPAIQIGDYVNAIGEFKEDKKYGKKFAGTVERGAPNNSVGLVKFLTSKIKGIGEQTAKDLTAKFGDGLKDIIINEPHRLKGIKGLGAKRIEKIIESTNEAVKNWDAHAFFRNIGFGEKQTARIIAQYFQDGEKAVKAFKNNPYAICDIDGFGFKSVDICALKYGVAQDSPFRMNAAVMQLFKEMQGHTGMPRDLLIRQLGTVVSGLDQVEMTKLAEKAIAFNVDKGLLFDDEDKGIIFDEDLFWKECAISVNLLMLSEHDEHCIEVQTVEVLPIDLPENHTFDDGQINAIKTSLSNPVSVITGGAGRGKTTIVKHIISVLEAYHGVGSVVLTAFTGKAARRMSEATGRPASTTHRLLAQHGEKIKAKAVILDEASMMDVDLFYDLTNALAQGTRFIIVGDANQLPSVGNGNVLADIIESCVIPVSFLTKVHRQSEGSMINLNADGVLKGVVPVDGDDFKIIPCKTPEQMANGVKRLLGARRHQWQVLSPMKKDSLVTGTGFLNKELQELMNPTKLDIASGLKVGDPVIQNKNDYDKKVMNGETGLVTRITSDAVFVKYEDNLVEYKKFDDLLPTLAYALTVHKTQGSEYENVAIVLSTQHYVMLARSILYTAITRGKKRVVIYCQEQALKQAVKNDKKNVRVTSLVEHLKSSFNPIAN